MGRFADRLKKWSVSLIDNIKSPHSFLNNQIWKFRLIGRGFFDDKCLLRASALAFTTLLSIVPLFAAILLVVKGFGSGSEAEVIIQRIEEFIQKIIPPEVLLSGDESFAHIIATRYYAFAERMSASRVGGIGVVFLIVTVISLLITVEESMNDIWGVKRRRSFLSRLVIYWSLITLTPVLLLPALSTGFASHSQYIVDWVAAKVPFEWIAGLIKSNLLPLVFMTLAFTIFYMIMPSTRVRFKSAFFGGVISSILFNLAVTTFGSIMAMTGKAHDFRFVYGALALVPLLLTFVYVVWVITLFGAEVAFADQNATTFYLEQETANASMLSKERLALRLVGEITKGFQEGVKIPSAAELHDRLMIPIRVINEILDMLDQADILVCVDDREMTYHPGRALDKITVSDVLKAIREYGKDLELPVDEIGSKIDNVLDALSESERQTGSLTIDKIVS